MHILNGNVHILSFDEPSGLTMPFRVCVNDDYAILQGFRTLQEKYDSLFRFCIGSAGENVHISTFLLCTFLKMCTFLDSGNVHILSHFWSKINQWMLEPAAGS